MKWFLYIIECSNGAFYTGIAKDPEKRFKVHKAGRGARYTMYNKPVRIVHIEPYRSVGKAMKREAQVKRMGRNKKIELIAGAK